MYLRTEYVLLRKCDILPDDKTLISLLQFVYIQYYIAVAGILQLTFNKLSSCYLQQYSTYLLYVRVLSDKCCLIL